MKIRIRILHCPQKYAMECEMANLLQSNVAISNAMFDNNNTNNNNEKQQQ